MDNFHDTSKRKLPQYDHYSFSFINIITAFTSDIFIAGAADEGTNGLRRVNSSFHAQWVRLNNN